MSDSLQLHLTEEAIRAIRLEAAPIANKILKAAQAAGKSEEHLIVACDGLLADFTRRFA